MYNPGSTINFREALEWFGLACWPTSPAPSIRNCCCGTNIWLRRTVILKAQIKGRLLLSEADKAMLAEIAHRLGRKALEEVAAAAKPDTILGWYGKLIANKFDGSRFRHSAGRPRVDEETEGLVVQMAKENPTWGYDRIVGG